MFQYEQKRKSIPEILDWIPNDSDLIVPIGNGEPDLILTALDTQAKRFSNLKIHQMLPLKGRKYIDGFFPDHVRFIAYFLSKASRKAFLQGNCDLVPNHFHEVPKILQQNTKKPIVLASASPMDEHGYFSLGTQADYVASFIGKVPFILEVNQQMPRTHGANQIHLNQVSHFIETEYPLYEQKNPLPTEADEKIAAYVAERIDNGSTLQVGIGGIPNAIIGCLKHHQNLGIHTELLTDGVVDLVEAGVITGIKKKHHVGKIVATFALGTQKLYDFIHNNTGVEMLGVDYVNDPRIIAKEDDIVSINATTEVDFLGQCASETIGGKYYSSSGGQSDFARGVCFAENGKGFICLHSTAKNGAVSRIRAQLSPGSVVTTSKNDVDHIVTEYGVAELKGKPISQRVHELIKIAHPDFHEELLFDAFKYGYIDKKTFYNHS